MTNAQLLAILNATVDFAVAEPSAGDFRDTIWMVITFTHDGKKYISKFMTQSGCTEVQYKETHARNVLCRRIKALIANGDMTDIQEAVEAAPVANAEESQDQENDGCVVEAVDGKAEALEIAVESVDVVTDEPAMSPEAVRWLKSEAYLNEAADRAMSILTPTGEGYYTPECSFVEASKVRDGLNDLADKHHHNGPAADLVDFALWYVRARMGIMRSSGCREFFLKEDARIQDALKRAAACLEEAKQQGISEVRAARADRLMRHRSIEKWVELVAIVRQRTMIESLGDTASPIECDIVDGEVANSTRRRWNAEDDVNQRHAADPYREQRQNDQKY